MLQTIDFGMKTLWWGHMQNLYKELEDLLSKDATLHEDWKLLKNKVIALSLSLDPKLISLLLKTETLKNHFFQEIDGVFVFDKVKFQRFVSNKSFLPDSYTSYKNKIGLWIGEDYLSDSKEVSLLWAYKDCVLEGGQDKEEAKRKEIFHNETLAPDQINRLLAPKVLTNWRKYDKNGVNPVKSVSSEDNIIIKGNNLLALHSLLPVYEGKVRLIYIDPPFNTWNDSFHYNDRFSRSTWLTFMKNRLEVAKKLLSNDGNIFIHIDVNQSHYLKSLCDEVFQEQNFVEEIIWAYGSPSGGRAAGAKPVNIHDYILHYAKSYSDRKQNKIFIPYSEKYIKDWFKYTDDDGRQYQRRMRGKDENGESLWEKQYLDESKGIPLSTVWNDIKQVYADPRAYKENQAQHTELEKEFTGWQKPEELIKRMVDMCTDEGDIVLDYHLGTGTTIATAHKMKRRYIWVEQMEYLDTITIPRMQKIIWGSQSGISKDVDWQWGGSFVYVELAKMNEDFIVKIEEAKKTQDLEIIWGQMVEKAFLSYRVDPKTIDIKAREFQDLSLEDQKRFLLEVLDKNMLYIPYSEISDKSFDVSDEDKKLNTQFYAQK